MFTENCHGNTQITQALECDCCLPCDIGYLCHGKTIRVSGQAKHHKCTHSLCFLFLAMCDLHTLLHFQECTMMASSRHPQEDYLKCCIGATSHFLSFFFFFIFFFLRITLSHTECCTMSSRCKFQAAYNTHCFLITLYKRRV